jgi:hypothetical protein
MTPLRAALPLLLLVPACGDSGRGDGSAGSITNITGATVATVPTGDPTTGGGGDSEASPTSGGAPTAGSASMTGDPATTTTPDPDTGPDETTTGPDPGTSTEPPPSGTTAEEMTFSSFSDTTDGEVCNQQIDIVFSMDVSTSMLGILQKLENEILAVDDKLKTLTVVPDVNYGLVVFVDDYKIINNGAPYADVQTLKSDFNFWWNFTQSNQEVNGGGSNVDWPENSIDALYTAAVAFQWRPVEDTVRLVIHCTDDTFGDKGALLSGIPVQRSYDEAVQALQGAKARVFVFADNDKTGGPGNNEDVSFGFFTPYQGKTPIPDATDGGAFNINLVNNGQLSLSAAITDSVEQSLCMPYVPQ